MPAKTLWGENLIPQKVLAKINNHNGFGNCPSVSGFIGKAVAMNRKDGGDSEPKGCQARLDSTESACHYEWWQSCCNCLKASKCGGVMLV